MAFHILVLAGGSGTRLWPLSRQARPKHLLPLGPHDHTLLRSTVDRVAPLGAHIHVVTAAEQADGCITALEGCAADVSVIAEPMARGTGPALGLAVHQIAAEDPDALIASVHADHHVGDAGAYRAALLAAAGWARSTGGLATVGLTPTYAATGFGYIEVGQGEKPGAFAFPMDGGDVDATLLTAAAALPASHALAFVEKPSAEVAAGFLTSGHHLWNLGLFAWPARFFLDDLARADPELDAGLVEVVRSRAAGHEDRATERYAALRTVAVEPLVFERTAHLTVVRAAFGWSDLGSWGDLRATRAHEADADGNLVSGDAVVVGSTDCLVESRGGRTVAVLGAQGMVVVDTGDAVLVMPAAASQDVRSLVDRLRAAGRLDLL